MSLAHVQDSVAFSVYESALLPSCPTGTAVLSFAFCAVNLYLSPSLRYLAFLFSCSRVYPLSTLLYPLSAHCLPLLYAHCGLHAGSLQA